MTKTETYMHIVGMFFFTGIALFLLFGVDVSEDCSLWLFTTKLLGCKAIGIASAIAGFKIWKHGCKLERRAQRLH